MSACTQLNPASYACFCFRLSWDELIDQINARSLSSVTELQEQTCAGSACGGCSRNLKSLFEPLPSRVALLELAHSQVN